MELQSTYKIIYSSYEKWCEAKGFDSKKPTSTNVVSFMTDVQAGWPRLTVPKKPAFVNRRLKRLLVAIKSQLGVDLGADKAIKTFGESLVAKAPKQTKTTKQPVATLPTAAVKQKATK